MHETSNILPDIKLQFNVKHQVFEECYQAGYACAVSELTESENPHLPNTIAHAYWTDGWWDGFYAEPSLFAQTVSDESTPNNTTTTAANDSLYPDGMDRFLMRFLEISGVLAVSAIVGYQLVELVA